MEIKEKVIQIIEKLTDYKNLRDNLEIDLLENEILDSLTFIELMTNLEEEFNIDIQPTQVNPNTWRSIDKIAELVQRLNNSKGTY